jgi:hypothetical protein
MRFVSVAFLLDIHNAEVYHLSTSLPHVIQIDLINIYFEEDFSGFLLRAVKLAWGDCFRFSNIELKMFFKFRNILAFSL